MKTSRSIALSTLLIAGAIPANSQTVIRITGSNGDRTATQTAIANILDPGWTFQGVTGSVSSSGSLAIATGANFGAWNGSYGGTPVVIKVSFSGALAGIAAIAGNTDQRYVVSNGTGSGSVPNPLTGTQVGVDHELAKADFAFSTNFQSTSPFNGVFGGTTYSSVIEEIVGVSPLGFYASPGFPGTPSNPRAGYTPNITTQVAQLLFTTGSVRLSQITGDYTNDNDKTVWAIGRNTDAGQRYGAYTEIGLGTSVAPRVWQPTYSTPQTSSGGLNYGGTVGSHALWPAETVSGIFSGVGQGGYSSGQLLAEALTSVLGPNAYKGSFYNPETEETEFLYPDATAGYYIGYITPGDANNRLLGNNGVLPVGFRGVALNYNGVANTTANVKNGTYTLWLYNRIIKPSDGRLTGVKLNFANDLSSEISTTTATAGGGFFDDASHRVRRFTDGGLVVPK